MFPLLGFTPGIKAKRRTLVKPARVLLTLLAAGLFALPAAAPARAAESLPAPPPEDTPDTPNKPEEMIRADSTEKLPDIEARKYSVTATKHSKSARVYLFDDTTDAKPVVGRILLLKQDDQNVMAFRVVKTYEDKKQFAAKRVKSYGLKVLPSQTPYDAVEKTLDVGVYTESQADKRDLKELEYDPVLDKDSSPPPKGGIDSVNENAVPDEFDDDPNLVIEEIERLDPYKSWLSFRIGLLATTAVVTNASGTTVGGLTYKNGGGFSYGYSVLQRHYFNKAHMQDSLVIEGAVYFYKLISVASTTDSYAIVPIVATARYNLTFTETFTAFGYVGIMKNNVVGYTTQDQTGAVVSGLGAIEPAIGVGVVFRVGPNWDLRFDLGYDQATMGLMLRY